MAAAGHAVGATAQSATVEADVDAGFAQIGFSPNVLGHQLQTAWPTPGALTRLDANATVTKNDHGFASTTQTVAATWQSANRGEISVVSTAATAAAAGFIGDAGFEDFFRPPWSYTFTADSNDKVFTLGFDLTRSGDGPLTDLGLWGVAFEGGAALPLIPLSSAFGADTNHKGQIAFALEAGTTYTISLENEEFIVEPTGSARDLSFIENALFDWSITDGQSAAVPEPASWALMLAGFGGVGALLRRSRSRAVVAA